MSRKMSEGKSKQGILADLNFQIHEQSWHIMKQQAVKENGEYFEPRDW